METRSKIGMDSEIGVKFPNRSAKDEETKNRRTTTTKKKKKKKRYDFLPKFGCLRLNDDGSTEEKADGDGSFNVEATRRDSDQSPTHLVVMVNGIIGSAHDWSYGAKHFARAYPNDVIVHCSESNASTLTFDGVDVMGTRLAEEVKLVVSRRPNLQKISFVGHSLGGLVARYAVAMLYRQGEEGEANEGSSGNCSTKLKPKAFICGLEPVNFITVATPHLGSRGHKQVPVFCGSYGMEIFAMRTSWLLGKTGKHLFLCDCKDGKPPLLLQMSSDKDLPFISALQSFNRRVAYANVRFDPLVGWGSSSLRRRNDLPKRRSLLRNDKYRHIVNEEQPSMSNPQEEINSGVEIARRRRRTHNMEESMIRGLTSLSWERIDVKFGGTLQRFFAHNTIQVKTYCINSEGADVVQHMIDNFQL